MYVVLYLGFITRRALLRPSIRLFIYSSIGSGDSACARYVDGGRGARGAKERDEDDAEGDTIKTVCVGVCAKRRSSGVWKSGDDA
jgi:hypothetical protein